MTESCWSHQGETFSVEYNGVLWHFRKLKRAKHPPVELRVVEHAKEGWSIGVSGEEIRYADLPDPVKAELKENQCVVAL